MKFSWVFVALCALSIGTGSILAEEAHKQNVAEGLEIQTPFKAETDMDMIALQEQEAAAKDDDKMAAENPILEEQQMDDEEESGAVVKKDLPENEKEMEKVENMKEAEENKENEVGIQAAKEAEMLEQPGMRRLARYLRNFHGRQIFRANAALAAAKMSNAVSDEDEDAIAEERAVRRRKRVRRRNSKNKVKRHHRNRHVANRRNSSRRRTNNRSSSKRKNVRRVNSTRKKNRKNTRIVPISDYPVRRRGSSGVRRKTGTRSGSRRKSSKRKSKKNKKNKKKKSKKNKKKKQKKRRNQNRQQDSTTGRKGEEVHKEDSAVESHEGAQNPAQESQQQQQ